MQTQEIQQDLERFRRDTEYFDRHRQEFLQQYPEQWVAVYHQQVVGAARDPKRLVKQLERKGIPPGLVFHEYVTDQEDLLIL
ncbi:MAG: hypothetical protein GEU73_01015 [Chloroflexi bacterium]|nr:hypothetical protein [Chloroflexota bacterium]